MRLLALVVAAAILPIGIAIAEAGTNEFYVNDLVPENGIAPGDDANSGTSPETPMAHIQALLRRYPAIGSGCTVHVSAGTYDETIVLGATHAGLTLLGDGPGKTIIDRNQADRCLKMNGMTSGTISGFTFTRGRSYLGGAISCSYSSPTIAGNEIKASTAYRGGGIWIEYTSSPVIAQNTFLANNASWNSTAPRGGAIYCHGGASPAIVENVFIANGAIEGGAICAPEGIGCITGNTFVANTGAGGAINLASVAAGFPITNNVIARNEASGSGYCGGGLCISYSAPDGFIGPLIRNNTIVDNVANAAGGGVYLDGSPFVLTNNVLRGNTAPAGAQVCATAGTRLTVAYCNVQNGRAGVCVPNATDLTWGLGNMDSDPLFADAANGDYHLKSRYGRWDPDANSGAGGWVRDEVTSPCINAGDPSSDYSSQLQPSRRIEIGAYGNTSAASMGKWILAGDTDGSSRVDLRDLFFVRDRLGQSTTTADNWKADVNEDGKINILDLLFVRNRFGSVRP